MAWRAQRYPARRVPAKWRVGAFLDGTLQRMRVPVGVGRVDDRRANAGEDEGQRGEPAEDDDRPTHNWRQRFGSRLGKAGFADQMLDH